MAQAMAAEAARDRAGNRPNYRLNMTEEEQSDVLMYEGQPWEVDMHPSRFATELTPHGEVPENYKLPVWERETDDPLWTPKLEELTKRITNECTELLDNNHGYLLQVLGDEMPWDDVMIGLCVERTESCAPGQLEKFSKQHMVTQTYSFQLMAKSGQATRARRHRAMREAEEKNRVQEQVEAEKLAVIEAELAALDDDVDHDYDAEVEAEVAAIVAAEVAAEKAAEALAAAEAAAMTGTKTATTVDDPGDTTLRVEL
jgi:hypothetical protein